MFLSSNEYFVLGCVCIYIYMYVCMHVFKYVPNIYIYIYVCIYIYTWSFCLSVSRRDAGHLEVVQTWKLASLSSGANPMLGLLGAPTGPSPHTKIQKSRSPNFGLWYSYGILMVFLWSRLKNPNIDLLFGSAQGSEELPAPKKSQIWPHR